MKRVSIIISVIGVILIVFVLILSLLPTSNSEITTKESTWWEIQAIDTVKYSRDLAREKDNDISYDDQIEKQVSLIASTGATHVSIGTPYDEEFIPFLKRWVDAARRHGMNVWFRGNFSGWESWFDHDRITRDEHKEKLENFILDNGELFENEDIFSPCTECENGGPGDPRITKDYVGHQQFLIDEYKIANESFRKVGKNVRTNFPMNGDVARRIMDKETTKALGGIVVVDHYVSSVEKLRSDIEEFAEISGGRVILGEFGAPIPDLHGDMTKAEQASFVSNSFKQISEIDSLVGVNYWTAFGGSTKMWESDGTEREVAEVVKMYYFPKIITGKVKNEIGWPVKNAKVYLGPKTEAVDEEGNFTMPYIDENERLLIQAPGYKDHVDGVKEDGAEIVLVRENEGTLFKLIKWLRGFFRG